MRKKRKARDAEGQREACETEVAEADRVLNASPPTTSAEPEEKRKKSFEISDDNGGEDVQAVATVSDMVIGPTNPGQEEENENGTSVASPEQKAPQKDTYDDESFSRIKQERRFKVNQVWCALIPNKTMYKARSCLERCLVKFGARYPSAESAARAADEALIAMWGLGNSEEYLNFPPYDYDPSQSYQRFGYDLSSFLASLIEKGAQMFSSSTRKKSSHSVYSSWLIGNYVYQELKRDKMEDIVKQNPTISLNREQCGVCPHCRQVGNLNAAIF